MTEVVPPLIYNPPNTGPVPPLTVVFFSVRSPSFPHGKNPEGKRTCSSSDRAVVTCNDDVTADGWEPGRAINRIVECGQPLSAAPRQHNRIRATAFSAIATGGCVVVGRHNSSHQRTAYTDVDGGS
jgi:hypothetical protein